jgi:hypothetical protein
MTELFELWWVSEDGQGMLPGGGFSTRELAAAATEAFKAELLEQCGDEGQRLGILAGTFEVYRVAL